MTIVVIPIAIGMPAVAVFVPPAMALIPAAFACFAQFMTRTIRLPAVPAVMFHGFVEFVVRLDNAPLAAAVVIRQRDGGPRPQLKERVVHLLDSFGYCFEIGGQTVDVDDLPPDRVKVNVGKNDRPVWRRNVKKTLPIIFFKSSLKSRAATW